MKTIEGLDERLSAVYVELNKIKSDMAKLYEAEDSNDGKVVRLGLVLNDITNIQQTIEDESMDEMVNCPSCEAESDGHQDFCWSCLQSLD